MIRSELVKLLNDLPDIEVGDEDGGLVIAAHESTYDAGEGDVPYICLEVDEG